MEYTTILFAAAMLSILQGCTGSNDSRKIASNTPSTACAKHIDLGTEDHPVIACYKILGPMERDKCVYKHVIGIEYSYFDSRSADTLYYETIGRKDLSNLALDTTFRILPHLGDATINVQNNSGDVFQLFSAIESHEFGRNFNGVYYFRVPKIATNLQGNKESNGSLEISLKEIDRNNFTISLVDGANVTYVVKADDERLTRCLNYPIMSYYDEDSKLFFLVDKGVWLAPSL